MPVSQIHKFHIGYTSANQVGFSMSSLFTYFKKILMYLAVVGLSCGAGDLVP